MWPFQRSPAWSRGWRLGAAHDQETSWLSWPQSPSFRSPSTKPLCRLMSSIEAGIFWNQQNILGMALELWSQADLGPNLRSITDQLGEFRQVTMPQFPPLKNGCSSCHLRWFLGRINGITDVQCPVPCLIHRRYSCSSGFFPTAHPASPSPASEGLGLKALWPKLHALSLRALGFLRRSPGRKVETDSLSSWGSLTLGACDFATVLC